MRSAGEVLDDIARFHPREGEWLPLDALLEELWEAGPDESALPVLFGVFERFPDDDGAGVLWSIVYGVEGLPFDSTAILRDSFARTPSMMAAAMLKRAGNAVAGVSA